MGPRQVGKTTLAINMANTIPSVYLDLENRIDLQKAQDIEAFHTENSGKLIILDEVQRLPDIFAPIRGLIDQQRRKGNRVGQFLFLGSASIDLLKQSSEALAGRISYIEMFPVNVLEYTKSAQHSEAVNDLWLKGGFPDSLLAHGFIGSMSNLGDCWDNGVAESFFGSLKQERCQWQHYQTRYAAQQDVLQHIGCNL